MLMKRKLTLRVKEGEGRRFFCMDWIDSSKFIFGLIMLEVEWVHFMLSSFFPLINRYYLLSTDGLGKKQNDMESRRRNNCDKSNNTKSGKVSV